MTITLGGLTLPSQLEWVDEFDYAPVAQSIKTTLDGSLVVTESQRRAGRPYSLRSISNGGVWVTRDFVRQLKALEAAPQTDTMTLNINGHVAEVFFRRDPVAVTATPLWREANPQGDSFYFLDILLIGATS